ncbi:MAG: LPXTG cell wall anchor domain-containing protein, partial [Methanosarcinales archaeon]
IKVIKSKVQPIENGKGKIELDVANTRPNAVSAVSVIPHAKDLEFFPREYFIGRMDSDELFTIEFDINAINANATQSIENKDIAFKVVYKNGDNLHESKAQKVSVSMVKKETKSNNNSLAIIGGVGLIAIVGLVYFRKRKK